MSRLGLARKFSSALKNSLGPDYRIRSDDSGVEIYRDDKLIADLAIEDSYPDDAPPDAEQRYFKIINYQQRDYGVWLDSSPSLDEEGNAVAAIKYLLITAGVAG